MVVSVTYVSKLLQDSALLGSDAVGGPEGVIELVGEDVSVL